jgi:DNA-binding transcriptional LysR family regulator
MRKQRDLPASLDALRGFEAAARHLSFTNAGAELALSQSAVSRQVQALEEDLGVKLFQRRTRALALTEAGELYYREVSKALRQLRDATAGVRVATDPVVRVTTPITFASLWLVPRLPGFQTRHEDITVHVAADNTVRDLERASLDVAVRYSTAEIAGAGAHLLFGEQVVPVCSPALAHEAGRSPTPERLMRLPLLYYEEAEGRTPWLTWNVWAEAMKLPAPGKRRGLSFTHYDQLIQAAVAGQGLALGRLPLVKRLIDQGKLVAPLKGDRYATRSQGRAYWVIVSERAAARAEVRTFVAWLRKEATAAASL